MAKSSKGNRKKKKKKDAQTRSEEVINFKGNLDKILPIACGADVHKSFLVAVICTQTDPTQEPVYVKQRFSTFSSGLRDFAAWLKEHNCRHVCMESTGVYWVPVFNVLESLMEEVRIVNPKWVKAVKGEKDDTKDAAWICNKYRHGETRGSYIPPVEIRDLRNLTRLQTKYQNSVTQDKNRAKNVLTQNNYKLDMVFSDTEGLSAAKITEIIISGKNYTASDILACVHPRCKAAPEDILKAVDGIKLSRTDQLRIKVIRRHMAEAKNCIAALQLEIDDILKKPVYKNVIDQLITIPGVGMKAAQKIIAELGIDMSQFKSASALCKWGGLASGSNESAGKKFSVHITKSGKYLKPVLVECAWAAVKSKDNYYRLKFNAISARQGKKRAIVAIARMLLVSIYHMLTKGMEWCPTDMDENHVPHKLSVRSAKAKFNNSVEELNAHAVPVKDIIEVLTSMNITGEEIVNALVDLGESTDKLLYALTGEIINEATA